MELSLETAAEKIGGELSGDPAGIVTGVAGFFEAEEHDITYAESKKLFNREGELVANRAGAVIVPESYRGGAANVIRTENPKLAFFKIVKLFHPFKGPAAGISAAAHVGKNVSMGGDVHIGVSAHVGDGVELGDGVVIFSGAFVGDNTTIGDDTVIFPNVTIYDGCVIGKRVMIHSGTVVGCYGFGHVREGARYHTIPHIGNVRIDDDVELGACNTIARGTMGKTWIKRGVKTDNMVHVAHNVTIGEDTILVAQVAISGSVTVGNSVIIAGQSGIAGHLEIGDGAIVGGRSGVGRTLESGEIVSGSPEMPHKTWLRMQRTLPKLPEMAKRLKKLEKRLERLEKEQN